MYYLDVHKGSGRSKILLSHALSNLEIKGFKSVTLWVLQGNDRAIKFYENNGFKRDGKIKIDKREGLVLREIRMVK